MSKFGLECFVSRVQRSVIIAFATLLLLAGCATQQPVNSTNRPFSFEQDTFSYRNELTWVYGYDSTGKWSATRRDPKPDYTLHCFVVARAAKQFFQNARFDAAQPKADAQTYRRLVRKVVAKDPRHVLPDAKKTVIPGYANLREFSRDYESLLKDECGGFWRSYCQRGNWRMVFPFSRRHQADVAEQLFKKTKEKQPVVVHIAQFPELTINHAIVLFDATSIAEQIRFSVYDPNYPEQPSELVFDRSTRTFSFPQNTYFAGGRVDVYEIYRSLLF